MSSTAAAARRDPVMRRRLIHQTIFLDAQIDLRVLLVSVIISLSAHLVAVADRKINDAAGSDGNR